MSKLTEKLNELTGEETVAFDSAEIEKQLLNSDDISTVVDYRPPKSGLDAELEAILRETEGYVIEPETESRPTQRPVERPAERANPEPSEAAKRILEEKAEEREFKKKKRGVIICAIAVAVLALAFVGILMLKNSADKREYRESFKEAQILYYDGKYDEALEELREAMAIDKTDECLMLMSQCYEAKYDYVNAIAILESSNSDNEAFKKRIEKLKKDKQDYENGKIVLICGEQYDVGTTVLDLSGKGIRSGRLNDVGKLTELTNLKLADNNITNIEFLKPLSKLVSLDLSNNQITDISPLASLKQLRTLHLDNNDIKDFSPLYELKNLTMLTISGIDVKESQIKELKQKLPGCLIYNDEADTDVVSVRLGGKTFNSDVTELDLSGCSITDLSPLSVCTELEKLNLSGNYIRDISPLLDIPKLRSLNLSDNSISDIRPLMSITTLEYLNLADNDINSITALAELKNLRELVLDGNEINNTQSISKLNELRTLGLKNTDLEDADLDNLHNLKNLTKLSLEGNPALTESAVKQLEKKLPKCKISHSEFPKKIELGGKQFPADATSVDASDLGISNISAASGFKSVKTLDLSGNIISSVAPLSSLKTLEVLNLHDNNISDVTPLYSLTRLKQLNIGQNGLSDEQIEALREALPNCTITVE